MFSKRCHNPVYWATLDTSRINIALTSIFSVLFSRPPCSVLARHTLVLFPFCTCLPICRCRDVFFHSVPLKSLYLSRLLLILQILSFIHSLILSFIYSFIIQPFSIHLVCRRPSSIFLVSFYFFAISSGLLLAIFVLSSTPFLFRRFSVLSVLFQTVLFYP